MITNPTEMLVTIAQAKAEAGGGIVGSASDGEISQYIAGISQYWLQRCGVYSLSKTFNLSEVYNGTGNQRLKLRNPPCNSVASLAIGNCIVPPSTAYPQQGYGIEDNQNFIFLRGYVFQKGIQNIFITYNAGNDGTPADIVTAVCRHVMLAYKRKDNINLRSLSGTAGGSSTYLNDIELTPDIERVIRLHSRLGL